MRVVSPSPHWGAYVAEHKAHASGDHVRIMQHARSSACAHLGIHITKQTLSIALQRCHALSLEKGANYVAGRLAQDQNHNTRQPTTATGTSHDLSHGPPQ